MPEIRSECHDGLFILTLNRPTKANALTVAMNEAMAGALREARDDAAVRGVLITGAGERAFSGGVDVRETSALPPDEFRQQRSTTFFAVLMELVTLDKPVVAAVNGAASGGGFMIAALADFIIASESASFALPEIDLGTPPLAGLAILAPSCGGALAYDLVQTGRKLDAAEAGQRGLARAVVPPGDLLPHAEQFARELMAKNARAFARSKRWMREPLRAALERAEHEMVVYRAQGGV
jgi:enoyl-CoA hydratase/carnithine racemase